MTEHKIPVTAIIATKNEEENLPRCLESLKDFDQVIVHDSYSTDKTLEIASTYSAEAILFQWNGQYPKKRQYFLDNHADIIKHDWVFFVDADEILTHMLAKEIKRLMSNVSSNVCGYFVQGQYIWQGKTLKYGQRNNKLALFNRNMMHFPEVNDLDITSGLGEIEGHYQPVKHENIAHMNIGKLKAPLLHSACTNLEAWHKRHKRYAHWEDEMDRRKAWPKEDSKVRSTLKTIFKALPPWLKASITFSYSYIAKLGFLDGLAGYEFAKLRASYYWR